MDSQTTASDVPQEAARQAALDLYGVLDTDAEPAFDEIVDLAARLCGTASAAISLIDGDRQWFKARVGVEPAETPRSDALCDHAIRTPEQVLVIPDTTRDARSTSSRLVTGAPYIRFYAGAPLVTPDGRALGALCVLDGSPRPEGLTELQRDALAVLAHQVVARLELRRKETERLAAIELSQHALEASGIIGVWDWDVPADRVRADARFAEMYDVDPDQARAGLPIRRFMGAFHPDDVDRVSLEIDAALVRGGPFRSQYRLNTPGGDRWVIATGQCQHDGAGRPVRFTGVSVDMTAAHEAERRLAESEAKFRAMADAMPQMVWSTLPDGFHDYYNARWYEFTGVPEGSTDGEAWNGMFHPEDQERARAAWRHSLETGDPYEIEYRLRHRSGVYRWTLGRAHALRDADGRIMRWFGTCTDIDDIKKGEQARELLSQELSHRIKNIFAVVSALIALSARQHPEAKGFAQALRTRIGALASAHEFVRPHTDRSRATVGSMTLHAFLADLFRPYADETGRSRVLIEGEDLTFDDQAATPVALLFHELATNAAKYGALSVPEGVVRLTSQRRGDRILLTWAEAGGPAPMAVQSRAGFGSTLTATSVEGQLGGRLSRDWRPEGLVVVADLPETALSRRRAAKKS